MMFHFIYDSLGATPQKKLSTKLAAMDQDGPLLLKTVFDQTFAIKERFYELSLKKYKWNVQALNQDVREKLADLIAAGSAADETDILISLFQAYKTATNEEFLHAIDYWKNEWNSGSLSSAEQLVDRADKKYVELRDLNTWGKRSDKDDQIIALTTQIGSLKRGGSTGTSHGAKATGHSGKGDQNKRKGPKWKYNRSASSTNELKKNGKTYRWCTGPGHGNIAIWVAHEPGQCTANHQGNGNSNATPKKTYPGSKTMYDRDALTSKFKNKGNLSDDEVDSKVEAILAVMAS